MFQCVENLRYLNFSSHHLVQCLFSRAEKVMKNSKNSAMKQKSLMQVLKENGYPGVFCCAQQRMKEIFIRQAGATRGVFMISGLSKESWTQMQYYFRTMNTLRQQLCKIKERDSTKDISKVVYATDCSCGKNYIGETKRTLNTRLSEHPSSSMKM